MRCCLILPVFLLAAGTVVAQPRIVRIVSARNGAGIANVVVSGLGSDRPSLSDSSGFTQIDADDPGPFRFSHLSYQTRILRPDSTEGTWIVRLPPAPYSLEGVEVLSPLARYRRDSAFNHSFFRRELADAKFKPGKKIVFIPTPYRIEIGIQWSGMLTNLAMVVSGKKAQYRRFAKELKRNEAGKFAAIRYTPMLVSEQTGLEEDSAMAFIAKHPIEEDFLRNASEIELKMRVREMHRTSR